MDQVQPAASQYRGGEPISGGTKALMILLAIFIVPIGSIIAWIYGARNSHRDGAAAIRLTGMIFTVIYIMGGLVLGAAILMIPGFLTKGQDDFLAQAPVTAPPADPEATETVPAEEMPADPVESPEVMLKKAELKDAVGQAIVAYHEEHETYPTLEELNAAGLLDERFADDPAHPEEGYLVQLTTWTENGKPGCNVNIIYTGEEMPDMGIASAAGEVIPGGAAAGESTPAEPAQHADETTQQAMPPHRDSGKRGAARWQQFI